MAKQIFSKDERHAQAVKIGVKYAKQCGVDRVSLGSVAAEMGVTAPLLFHVFGNREGFHKAINKAAKAAGVTLPEAQLTVRAERALRRAERDKKVKKLSAGAKAAPIKLKPPKVAKKIKLPPVKAKPIKLAPPKAPAKKRVRPPKVKKVAPELAKFPALPVPTPAATAAA